MYKFVKNTKGLGSLSTVRLFLRTRVKVVNHLQEETALKNNLCYYSYAK